MKLNDKGRCCGRKAILYKRPDPHKFCPRCFRSYHPITGEQVANWAWEADARFPNGFVRRPNRPVPPHNQSNET